MLKIQNFSKVYDGKPAVDNLSLEVEAGDIYAFIGHNGAGKTTTIKACCGSSLTVSARFTPGSTKPTPHCITTLSPPSPISTMA